MTSGLRTTTHTLRSAGRYLCDLTLPADSNTARLHDIIKRLPDVMRIREPAF